MIFASNDDDETVDDADGDVTLMLGELLSEDIYCVNDDLTPEGERERERQVCEIITTGSPV